MMFKQIPSFSKIELEILERVYKFQKPRKFRFGLRKKYLIYHMSKKYNEDVIINAINNLINQGIIFVKRFYGNKVDKQGEPYEYIFLTKKGKEICENLFEESVKEMKNEKDLKLNLSKEDKIIEIRKFKEKTSEMKNEEVKYDEEIVIEEEDIDKILSD